MNKNSLFTLAEHKECTFAKQNLECVGSNLRIA